MFAGEHLHHVLGGCRILRLTVGCGIHSPVADRRSESSTTAVSLSTLHVVWPPTTQPLVSPLMQSKPRGFQLQLVDVSVASTTDGGGVQRWGGRS